MSPCNLPVDCVSMSHCTTAAWPSALDVVLPTLGAAAASYKGQLLAMNADHQQQALDEGLQQMKQLLHSLRKDRLGGRGAAAELWHCITFNLDAVRKQAPYRASLVPDFHPAQDLRVAHTVDPATTLAAAQVKCSESFGTLRTLGRGKYKGLQKVVPPLAACPRRGWQPAVVYGGVNSRPLSVAEAIQLVGAPEVVLSRCRPQRVRMALQLGVGGGAACAAVAWLVAAAAVGGIPAASGVHQADVTAVILTTASGTAAAAPRRQWCEAAAAAPPPAAAALVADASAAMGGLTALVSRHAGVGLMGGCGVGAAVGWVWSNVAVAAQPAPGPHAGLKELPDQPAGCVAGPSRTGGVRIS